MGHTLSTNLLLVIALAPLLGAIIAGLLRPTPSMMEDKPTLKLAANN